MDVGARTKHDYVSVVRRDDTIRFCKVLAKIVDFSGVLR
jgi:hypothetical protein